MHTGTASAPVCTIFFLRSAQLAGTVTSPLVPWNTCGVYISDTLDIGVAQYGIYAIFNWLMPVVNALCAYGTTLSWRSIWTSWRTTSGR